MAHKWKALTLAALTALAVLAGERATLTNRSREMTLVPLPLVADGDGPARTRVGALTFLAAWELRSDNHRFGGFSGLATLPGNRFLALSDSAMIAIFDQPSAAHGGQQRLETALAPLPWAGREPPDYQERDSESITADPVQARFWIGYEQNAAIRRFGQGLAREEAIARPPAMKGWPSNGGAEAMVRLSDGRFLVFSESRDAPAGGRVALLFAMDPTRADAAQKPVPFAYAAPPGYSPTDAAQLPDGRVLILQRNLTLREGFTAILSVADPRDIRPGKLWQGRILARLAPPLLVDNMEGIALTREGDKQIVWMISDDNFTILQRTLLMKFALEEKPESPRQKPARSLHAKGRADTARPGFEAISDR